MTLRRYTLCVALPVLAAALAFPASAQVEITDDRTTGVSTSTAGTGDTPSDVTITSTGSIAVTSGAAVTLDSDNAFINAGAISTTDVDDTTGVLISGVVSGAFTNSGTIRLGETSPSGGISPGGDIAQGSGRTGILISGGSSFTGNISNTSSSSMTIIGQDSAAIRLAALSTLNGDILQNGAIVAYGERAVGIDLLGDVIGNLAINSRINSTGEDSHALNVSGDISGGLTITGNLTTSGYVASTGAAVTTRPSILFRENLVETGSLREAGSAVQISGNIGNGIHIAENRDSTTDALISIGAINMFGSAPAILIDGNGTPIAIGLIGQITDPADADFDEDLQFAFFNQGTLVSDAILNDIDTTVFSLSDAHLEGGINNAGTLQSTSYRSGIDPDATSPTADSHARVIIIGGGGIAERINNTGLITARGFDSGDSIYADPENVQAPNQIFVTAIEVEAAGSLNSILNRGIISALITGRLGEAIAILDASGTLVEINNSGIIQAGATNSDGTGVQATNFTLTAIDVSANTTGFTLNQTVFTNPDTDIDSVPIINGNIFLGSGDDTINVAGGAIVGDISFGDGADRLEISNTSIVSGAITDSDGQLDILVTDNSRLNITGSEDIDVTTALVDSTSIYSPFINPSTGDVSVLMASGTVTFEDGAVIAPRLSTVLSSASAAFIIAQAATLNIDTSLDSLRSNQTPFLYNTTFLRSPTDSGTLIMTLDVRSTQELGLDASQAALFTSAFEALQNINDLGTAFVRITDQTEFNSAYNQLLPEFAAASRQFVLANVDGATGAVASHLANARRSQDRPGGAWIEEFAYYADRSLEGLSEQFRGYGFGITGGFDVAVGPFHTVGVNIGFATTEVEDVLGNDEPLDVLTIQLGGYAGYQTGALGIDVYAGVGYNDFEANRNVVIGDFNKSTSADWSGVHYNASLSAGYDISFGKKYFIRPAIAATYLSLSEKAYEEEGTSGIELALDKRTVNTGTVSATLNFGARYERNRSWMAPAFRVGVRSDVINDGVITTGRFLNGVTPFSLEAAEFPSTGILLGITFASGSQYSSFSFDYDTDIRDGFIRHTARMVLRLLF
ncbi:MAG: hypothetical protein COA69_14100 [Robiginitomaculum sp.]|nr:MAG: hypothetical protein COA69_14100 [Robiginitomaculum sp.]